MSDEEDEAALSRCSGALKRDPSTSEAADPALTEMSSSPLQYTGRVTGVALKMVREI